MKRTLFDVRPARKQLMRLAHVFLDIAAHILPLLSSKECTSNFATMHSGVKHQSRSHPRAKSIFKALMCEDSCDALQVAFLLPLFLLITHKQLARWSTTLIGCCFPSIQDEMKPTNWCVRSNGDNVPQHERTSARAHERTSARAHEHTNAR